MHAGLKRLQLVVGLAATVTLGGCFLLAAGAGAGAAVAYTNRGAESTVSGSIDQVFDRSTSTMQQLGITETGRATEASGAKRRIVGTKGDLEVTVELSRASDATTKVEVFARKNTVDYDRDFARDVLTRIVQAG
jgi:hypothetical protein